jgi:hypothetical protein
MDPAARLFDVRIEIGDWRRTAPFNSPRTSHAAVVVGDFLYIIGGLFASGSDFTLYDDVQIARFGNDGGVPAAAWSATAPIPIPRSGLGAAGHNGFLYVVGGFAVTEAPTTRIMRR